MAGARGSANNGGSGTRTTRGAGEGRATAYSRAARRTLTIGEAAAQLSTQFPGVTAALLRRLEATGQFTPARSSSGYRRYSEADLDLIRIVLANQSATRPHDPPHDPLPASATGPAGRSAGLDPADLSGAEHPLTHPAAGQSAVDEALAVAGAARDRSSGETRHRGHPGSHGGVVPRSAARAARAGASSVRAARSAVKEDEQSETYARRTAERRPGADALFDIPANGRPEDPGVAAAVGRCPAEAAQAPQSPDVTAPAALPSTAASRRAERRWPDAEFFAPDLGEVALDRDQLAAAARTDRAWVDGLVEYGLLSGNQSAGGADLLVARAAAELAQFGMEPRHLRAVAASAARVAELIASATASGAGRDPARRERALLAAPGRGAEAAAAAVRLHAALVRAALLRG